jgi:dienelactone hydrolase
MSGFIGEACFYCPGERLMTTVLLFHHAYGQTPGFLAFADVLRGAGHEVHTPDFYEGRLFADLDEGVVHAENIGFGEIVRRGRVAAEKLPPGIVYAGFSLGTLPAQLLAQTRPGARGALLFHGGQRAGEFSTGWQPGVPLEIHTTEADPWVEMDHVRQLVTAATPVAAAQLFTYPGSAHLFADPGFGDYDAAMAALLTDRTLDFLARIEDSR